MSLKNVLHLSNVLHCVKNYITPDDYKNLILVNKEFNEILSRENGSLILSSILQKDGFFEPEAKLFIKKELREIKLIKLMIDVLEDNYFYVVNEKMNKSKFRDRLEYLNLFDAYM